MIRTFKTCNSTVNQYLIRKSQFYGGRDLNGLAYQVLYISSSQKIIIIIIIFLYISRFAKHDHIYGPWAIAAWTVNFDATIREGKSCIVVATMDYKGDTITVWIDLL